MYGTLRGALAGRKIAFDREGFTATVEGRIVGVGKTIRIKSIHVHYELAVPSDSRENTERALAVHPQGCPAHQSVQGAIDVTWDARVRLGEEIVVWRSESDTPDTA
ncbi:MAG TPA: OsmC family protein [Methylomirabilota bacterium]|nr:OsmC family protein [Methylomirabilota bacterium]